MDPLTNWYAIAKDGVLLAASVLVFLWGRDRKHLQDAIDAKFELRDERYKALERHMAQAVDILTDRFDVAGEKVSRLASTVQGLMGVLKDVETLQRDVADVEKLTYTQGQEIAELRAERRFTQGPRG